MASPGMPVPGAGDAGSGGAGAPLANPRADFVRFRGASSRIANPVIYFPSPVNGVAGSPGAFVTLASGTNISGNAVRGWQPGIYGFPGTVAGSANNISPVRYEDSGRSQLSSLFSIDPITRASTPVLTPDANGAVSVFGAENIRLRGGNTYTNFTDASSGQIIHIVADGSPITFKTGSLVLKTGADTVAGPLVMTSFAFYTYGGNSAWFQI